MAHLGAAAWGRGDRVAAVARLEAAQALGRGAGLPFPVAIGGRYLGLIAAEAGDYARAAAGLREWAAYAPEAANILVRHSADVAALVAARGEASRAAMLFGAAAALAAATGFAASWPERGAHERAAAAARQALGDAAFDAGFDAGWRLPRDGVRAELAAALYDAAAVPAAGFVAQPGGAATFGLTPRELEVVRLVASGRSNQEVADALFVTVDTVKRHLTTVFAKLGLPSRAALTAYAHTHGLA
jgi:DNA-binding CsgD family transcriptional regulator